jgi:hypothetical protein|uniref:Uncharacterized protein n=1 Tax=virus sp. ctE0n6 TaxID=2827985 RepID=A0A8S5RFV9_9VIRU|nr:MAG TPA: hypothetical protein [virus sp. ctE0n6]
MSYLVLALKVLIKMSAIWGTCAAAFFLILAVITVATGSKTWLKDLLLDREIHKKNVEMINIEVKEVA